MTQSPSRYRTAIIGGGAAGFFLAVNLKEMAPEMEVTIFERSHKVLAKVEISGGGRCNCTNSFDHVTDLSQVYPRGHRLMKRLFNIFDYADAYAWFEHHGVPLVTQDDDCVFPASQDSHSIIDCFLHLARQSDVHIRTGMRIQSLDELSDFDFVVVTTGGQPRLQGLEWLNGVGEIAPPVPSLFTFNIPDQALRSLMGTVVDHASVLLPSTKFRSSGPLLITHWGMSGPAILKLSSYAARWLSEKDYQCPLCVNWAGLTDAEIIEELMRLSQQHPQKQLSSVRPFDLPQRLWNYLLEKSLSGKAVCRWAELGKKDRNRLANILSGDTYNINGRGTFRDEFVTCGGISLASVHPQTLESRLRHNLFFAGEILDIDGITGGFNFQAAWTTAFTVAQAIANRSSSV